MNTRVEKEILLKLIFLSDTGLEAQARSILLGAGNGVSRRRWALSTATLLFSFTIRFLIYFSVLWLFVRVFGERRSRQMLRRRRGLFVTLLSAVFSFRVVILLAMSREGSLTAAKLWSSGSNPVVPLSIRRHVRAFERFMEPRFQLMSLTSSSPGRLESHKPLQIAPLHQTDGRSQSITSSVLVYFSIISLPLYQKVMLSSPPLILLDGASFPLHQSFTGDLYFDAAEQPRSSVFRLRMKACTKVTIDYVWAWPIFEHVRPRYWERPTSLEERVIQRLSLVSDGVNLSSCDFNRIFPSRITLSHLSFGKILPVGSPGLVILRSSSSVSLSSVCFSPLIGLPSCVAISTGSEDAIEITSVVLVDEVWTSTSHFVTILQLSDFVVKTPSTHSSIVSNLLSSSVEDLSFLDYLCVVCYAYGQRGWKIPSFYCSEEV